MVASERQLGLVAIGVATELVAIVFAPRAEQDIAPIDEAAQLLDRLRKQRRALDVRLPDRRQLRAERRQAWMADRPHECLKLRLGLHRTAPISMISVSLRGMR